MLTKLALLLVLGQSPTPRHTVEAKIPGWSTASFRLLVNGSEVARIAKSGRFDLDPRLHAGKNEVEVRYETLDGKISRLAPAILRVERREGDRKSTPLRVAASEDNPRGRLKATLFVPSR